MHWITTHILHLAFARQALHQTFMSGRTLYKVVHQRTLPGRYAIILYGLFVS
jgi:hypothetical protein